MKKSTNESAPADSVAPESKPYRIPLLWEMFTMEGGLSLLIIFPLIVMFFLKMAYQSF